MPVKRFYDAPFALIDGGNGAAADYVDVARRFAVPLALTARSPDDVGALRELASRAKVDVTIAGEIGTQGIDQQFTASGRLDDLLSQRARAVAAKMPFAFALRIAEGGTLADGTPLSDAIEALDADPSLRAWNYLLDCTDPAHAQTACESLFRAAPALAHRVVGVRSDATPDFGERMHECAQRFGLSIVGTIGEATARDLDAAASLALQRR